MTIVREALDPKPAPPAGYAAASALGWLAAPSSFRVTRNDEAARRRDFASPRFCLRRPHALA